MLARIGHPFLSGIALMFPSITLVSLYFIGRRAGAEAVAISAKSALLATIFVWMPYIIAIAYFSPRRGVEKTMAIGVAIFIVLGSIWVYLNHVYGTI